MKDKNDTKIENLTHCPECHNDWSGSGLIGIEVRELYDGVSFWQCADCHATWDRWTGEKVKWPKG